MELSAGKRKSKYGDGQVSRKTGGDYVFTIINIFVFLLFAFICIFPFYYLVINTISDSKLVDAGQVLFFPREVHFNNYIALRNVDYFFSSLLITGLRTVFGTMLMVIVSAFAGYMFTQRKMWARKTWYRFVVITMYFNAGLIPMYINMFALGLTDNLLVYFLPGLVAPFNIILVKTYIESVPPDIEESARIDGAGTMTIFWRIIWPLCLPILATIAIFGAVGNWNSFQDSLLLMQGRPEYQTLQHALYMHFKDSSQLQENIGTSPYANVSSPRVLQFTISVVSIIPIVLVYPILQRYFVKGIMMGAVKG